MRKAIILFLIIPGFIFSLDSRVDNTSIYNEALGGAHPSMVKGFDSLYNNPALLGYYDQEVSIFELSVNLKGDALNILNLYLGDELSMDDTSALIDTLESEGLTSPLVGLNLTGPFSFGYIADNWGWAVENYSTVYMDVPGLLSTADFIAREDLMFSIGLAVPIRVMFGDKYFMEFTPGVMSRTTIRAEVAIESDLLGLMDYTSDFATILDDYPLYLSPMFAVDAGLTLNFYDIIMLSAVIKDIYTPILKYEVSSIDDALDIFSSSEDTTGNLIPRELNVGLGVDVPLGPIVVVVSDFDIYLSYFDLLDFDTNFWLHWGTGADLELLEKFHLMAGLNEGLLSMGLKVEFSGFNVGFVMYGTEEGLQPGDASTFNFLFSMGISI